MSEWVLFLEMKKENNAENFHGNFVDRRWFAIGAAFLMYDKITI